MTPVLSKVASPVLDRVLDGGQMRFAIGDEGNRIRRISAAYCIRSQPATPARYQTAIPPSRSESSRCPAIFSVPIDAGGGAEVTPGRAGADDHHVTLVRVIPQRANKSLRRSRSEGSPVAMPLVAHAAVLHVVGMNGTRYVCGFIGRSPARVDGRTMSSAKTPPRECAASHCEETRGLAMRLD